MRKKLFVVIVSQDKENETVKILKEKASKPTVIYGRGMASVINFGSLFGFTDDKRVALASYCDEKSAKELILFFKNEREFYKPNSGIAFYINIDGFIGPTSEL